MRVIKFGSDINVGRDVIINDNVNRLKLLAECASDELRVEEAHRQRLLKQEQDQRRDLFLRYWVIAGGLMLVAFGWAYLKGSADLVALISGGAGIVLGIVNLKAMKMPSEFEARQLAALNEIQMLLRERGER